jgi:aminopeptidase S
MRIRRARTVSAALCAAVLGTVALGTAAPSRATSAPAAPVAAPDVPIANVMAHLNQFQAIATANGGNRAHGRPGYRASVDYVRTRLEAAGFRTAVQPFTFQGATGWNVIADYPGGDPNNVVFLGAHLDSVPAGPGIHDNASGSAAILETALTLARTGYRPRSGLRFGWWGAEERGLIGSRHYVTTLPPAERTKIRYYLNYDMVGAPRPQPWGVYTDNATLQNLHTTQLRARGAATRPQNIGGASDHASFRRAGIAVGGMITGSDGCYHRACDTITNVTSTGMDISSDVVANVAVTLAGTAGSAGTVPVRRSGAAARSAP